MVTDRRALPMPGRRRRRRTETEEHTHCRIETAQPAFQIELEVDPRIEPSPETLPLATIKRKARCANIGLFLERWNENHD
jgi:hypothetical protein